MSWWTEILNKLFNPRPKPPVVPPPSPPPVPPPSPTGNELDAVNDYRRSRGRSPLRRSPCLESQATQHAVSLARNWSIGHSGFALRAKYCEMMPASENIAGGGVKTAAQAVQMWSTSAGHNANMLGNYAEGGIAVVNGAAVLIVGTRQMSGARLTDSPARLPSIVVGQNVSGISIG